MKLLIVDDDILIRKSLSFALASESDIEVVGTAPDGSTAIEQCRVHQPDIVLMDIRMPGIDGISATRLIKKSHPFTKVMVLTTFADKKNSLQALSAGADGYLVKTDKIASIAQKLRLLYEGTSIIDGPVLPHLTRPETSLLEKLSPRECDIARLVAQGLTNKEIANQLFLSEGTIRNKTITIMEKLAVSNRTQLGIAYYEEKNQKI